MNCILIDDRYTEHLLPFTYTRPAAEILVGILTIREKWEMALATPISYKPFRSYLRRKFPEHVTNENLYINGALLPDHKLVKAITSLGLNQGLFAKGRVLALKTESVLATFALDDLLGQKVYTLTNYEAEVDLIQFPEDIFRLNGAQIKHDFPLVTAGLQSQMPDDTNRLIRSDQIFVSKGAKLTCAIINATDGPVFIGEDAEIMEGAMIKGPFSLGAHSTIKMGAKIYGDSSIGPYCKIGGEVTNSVVFGYSNKGHDGFMGNSVIGAWCNWGADTNNSNLKNNYEIVKLWDQVERRFRSTGLQFAGLMMADHAKCGINTMFNTGTVVGVGANVFGSGFPRNFLPSFSWGGVQAIETFRFNKFTQTAQKVMERRGLVLDEVEEEILKAVYEETASDRTWEK